MDPRPQARTDGLIAERLDDGLVIYDRLSDQAHSLDAAAAALWSLADGTRTVRQIAHAAGIDELVAQAAIDRLAERGLLLRAPGVSRRSVLRRAAGIGAGALAAAPVIETLVIPVAAAHASVGPSQPPQSPQPPPNHPNVDPHRPGKPLILEEPTIVEGQPGPLHRHKKKKKTKKKTLGQSPHHPGKPRTHHRPHPKPKPKPKRKRRRPDEPEAPGTI
jgi:outer membrane biosynthesis protein TonB